MDDNKLGMYLLKKKKKGESKLPEDKNSAEARKKGPEEDNSWEERFLKVLEKTKKKSIPVELPMDEEEEDDASIPQMGSGGF